MPIALLEQAQRIDKSRVNEILKALPFFIGETLFAAIGLRVGEIQFSVCDVEVAASNHRLAFFKRLAIGEKRRVPLFEAQCEAAEILFRIRRVDGDDEACRKLGSNDPSFSRAVAALVVGEIKAFSELGRKAVSDGQWLDSREYRRARVALLDRRVPIPVITRQLKINLRLIGLGFLQTQHIGLMGVQKRME